MEADGAEGAARAPRRLPDDRGRARTSTLVDFVAEHLDGLGRRPRVVAATAPGRGQPARRRRAARRSGGILLAAHTDVVDVDGQAWTQRPVRAAARRRPRCYGRGHRRHEGLRRRRARRARGRGAARGCAGRCTSRCRATRSSAAAASAPLLDALERLPAPPAFCLVGEPTGLGVAVRHKGKAALRECTSAAAPPIRARRRRASTRSSTPRG